MKTIVVSVSVRGPTMKEHPMSSAPARRTSRPRRLLLASALPLAIATGCSTGSGPASTTPGPSPATPAAASAAESEAASPRLVITHSGGLQVVDARTLQPVADLPLPGFNRVNRSEEHTSELQSR